MHPFVSIILPVRNESNFIIPCLRSIAAQDYPKDLMELLIVDGLSDDDTLDQIAEFDSGYDDFHIQVLTNTKLTVPHAMNLGISKARGEIILRFDGHAVMEPAYVSNCVKYLEQTKADNVGGPAGNIGSGTAMSSAIMLAHASAFGLGGGAFRLGGYEGYTDTVTFGCFPRETFAKYGLYDPRLTRNQDIELNSRIRRGIKLTSEFKIQNLKCTDPSACVATKSTQDDMAGSKGSKNGVVNSFCDVCASCGKEESPGPGKIYLTPKIKSHYRYRETLAGLWSQNFSNGQWGIYTRYIAPYALSLRHFIPLIFVSSLIILSALSLTGLGASLWGRGAGTKLANLLHGFNGFGLKQPGLFSLKTWSWHLLFLRLLVLELGAYLGAMLFFILQSGKHKHKTDSSACKAGGRPFDKNSGKASINSAQRLSPADFGRLSLAAQGKSQNDTPDKDSIFSIQNSEFKPGSLALLPLVFVTLHFSYGLGSLWGLISLPYWAAGKPKR